MRDGTDDELGSLSGRRRLIILFLIDTLVTHMPLFKSNHSHGEVTTTYAIRLITTALSGNDHTRDVVL